MAIAFIIGVFFSPLAALMIFFITYNEYSHHYPGGRIPLKHALESALFAFVVFLLISILLGLALPSIVNKQ